ncbi:LicD family protein [Erysipelothrix aquatica]|uniref:LicD family protein n=1 Tax=Erysipelothrix aquatica TaxID=2683714 RepID=UPI00135BDCE3|nr:LicD family protein [Erysipelothrix aquatica]
MIVSDETITGDLIRRLQLNQLYLLEEFDLFCEKNGICYTLDFGSIIGAIRHKGFVPWDDDVDIAMLRWDYDKFLNASKLWENDCVFVQNYETDHEFVHSFTRLRLNNSLALQEEWAHLNIHHGVFIDIFPYDVMPDDEETISEHEASIHYIQEAKLERVRLLKVNRKREWKESQRVNPLVLLSLRDLNILQTEIMIKYNNNYNDTSFVSHMTQGFESYYCYRRKVRDQLFPKYGDFEGLVLPIPDNYEIILRNTYGDYLEFPPIDERKPHHGLIEVVINDEVNEKYYSIV